MNAQQIINEFELQVSDITELSTSEELNLLNKVYKRVCSERPWEILKKSSNGSILSDSEGSYIPLPTDFQYLSESADFTDNSIAWQGNTIPKLLYINNDPMKIVNFSDRRQYKSNNVAFVDLANNKIRFTKDQSGTYDFDYVSEPADLTLTDTPVFPSRFRDIFIYAMAVENDILQLSEKAKSYLAENQAKYLKALQNLEYWNAQQRYD